jgi:hypothetical protein
MLRALFSRKNHIPVFELGVVFIVVSSILAIVFLAIEVYAPLPILILSLIITTGIGYAGWKGISWRDSRFHPVLFLILLVALLFRYEPYLHSAGGQDHGKFVNAAAQLVEGNTDIMTDERVFPFYPLHPVWMSFAGSVFGKEQMVYSLTLVSLLSIVSLYLFATAVTGGKKSAGLVTAALLAMNPLHGFFSKFPANEMMALFFTSLGFYYLVLYYNRTREKDFHTWPLVLSALLMFCFMFTRLSFFLYLPVFYILALVVIIFCTDTKQKRGLLVYLLAIILLYALSLLFYWFKVNELFMLVFESYVIKPLLVRWQLKLSLILSALTLFLGGVAIVRHYWDNLRHYAQIGVTFLLNQWYIPVIVLIGLSVWGYRDLVAQSALVDEATIYFDIFDDALSFRFLSAYVVGLYLSPLGVILFFVTFYFFRKNIDPRIWFLLGFVSLFMIYFLFLEPHIWYQYYYARYLFSEIVPYGLVIVGVVLASLITQKRTLIRWAGNVLLILVLAWSTLFITVQLIGKEQNNPEFVTSVLDYVGPNDLLLINTDQLERDEEIKPALSLFGNRNVWDVHHETAVAEKELVKRYDTYDNIYILTRKDLADKSLFTYEETVPYQYGFFTTGENHFFLWNVPDRHQISRLIRIPFAHYLPPIEHIQFRIPYNLYQVINSPEYLAYKSKAVDGIVEIDNTYVQEHATGLYDSYEGWTDGNAILEDLFIENKGYSHLVLYQNFIRSQIPGQSPDLIDLQVSVNGIELEQDTLKNGVYTFFMPDTVSLIDEIQITSSTFTPEDLEVTEDVRELGVSIKQIRLENK